MTISNEPLDELLKGCKRPEDLLGEAVARWTHIDDTERPHSVLGCRTPAAFAAQLTAMADQIRAAEPPRRSPIAPPAQPRQTQKRTPGSAG